MWAEVVLHIGVEGVLNKRRAATVKPSGRVSAQRAVERVAYKKPVVVHACGVGQAPGAAAGQNAFNPEGSGQIRNARRNLRQKALGVDAGQIFIAVGITEKRSGPAVTAAQMAMAEQCGVALRQLGVPGQLAVLGIGIAKVQSGLPIRIRPGPVAAAPVAQLGSDIEKTIARQGRAVKQAGLALNAIALGGAAPAQQRLVGLAIAFEHDVDDAGNRIRAVLRCRAIAQHFHPLHRQQGDGVQVHAGTAPANRAVGVQQRALVQPLAIDQHQHLVGAEGAQGKRRGMVSAIRNRGAGVVESGHQSGQGVGQAHFAHGQQLLGGVHIGGHDGVQGGMRPIARANIRLQGHLNTHQLLQRQVVQTLASDNGLGLGPRQAQYNQRQEAQK